MLYILSQATQPIHHFDAVGWLPSGAELFRGGAAAASILVVGGVIYVLLRRYIQHVRLTRVFFITIVALAAYFGIEIAKPARMLDQTDLLALWLTRTFYAALLFAVVRTIDRLCVVPLLSRGGKVPLQRFVHQIVMLVITVFAVLGYGSRVFGWDIDKFLAGSAVVSIVLGLALQETMGNFFSGLVMHMSSPFSIGDWIRCAGVEGRVMDMNWRAVTIHTSDDNHVIVPNSTFAKEQIVNYHNPTTATARNVLVGLEYDLAPCHAIEVLKAAALETPGVLAAPEPVIYLHEYASSAIVYRVKFWIDDASRYPDIEHGVRLNTWYRLKQRGFAIPFQVQTVEYVDLCRKLEQQASEAAEERVNAIGSVPLLVALSSEQRRAIALGSQDILLAPGQVLFRQGDHGDSFYVIRRGTVDVLLEPAGGGLPHKLATLGPGDFFGEMSALVGQPRSATIRAATALAAIEICKDALNAIFQADPSVMEEISLAVAQRNAATDTARKGLSSSEVRAGALAEQKASILARMLRFFGHEPA